MKKRYALAFLVLILTACGRGERPDEAPDASAAGDGSPPAVATRTPPLEFAEELGVDLQAMRRTTSGLYVQDLEEGRGLGARAGHVLLVHYTGWLINGEKFDSSRDRGEPFSFQLGASQVIRGWDEGLVGIRIGGQRRLVIPPDLAYGARGVPGAIPPNATLVFEVELLDIKM